MGRPAPAPALILAARDETAAKADDPVYGDRTRRAWEWLTANAETPDRTDDVALAALLHDEGKAAPRFQRWLRGGDRLLAALADGKPLAKSDRRMTGAASAAARRTSIRSHPSASSRSAVHGAYPSANTSTSPLRKRWIGRNGKQPVWTVT